MKLKKEKKQRKKEIISIKDEKMRKKKEKLQKEREKWRKEKDEFRKREEDIARRKASQNAYKKKESGADFYEDQSLNATNLAFPDEPEEKREKPVNEEVKIEEEATIRILLSASQEKSDFVCNSLCLLTKNLFSKSYIFKNTLKGRIGMAVLYWEKIPTV